MMQGFVNESEEAIIAVVVRNGTKLRSVDAVIDTGFTGFLSLPISMIDALGLAWSYRDRGTLGDGSETLFDIYEGTVIWDGKIQAIEINAADTEPLLGMRILQGYRLQLDNVPGGLVKIEILPDR
ncbi:clan AA aspartic protease [filamentous cyanobacterium LEGE 11480]|uniref:Clan AA aspartic protease n=1 Tax=Romeriopsis navalis LEGE 11480 TaxID=2777977 RepID=A0A928VR82_9CYAN|nr:clan AA aspartic protease [Romeriopsis navalis]MBE9033186.1 clan AA aspartic protease [Romeriopsis navalis LEGE 11480]